MSETKEQTPDIFKVGHRGAIELLDYQTPNRIDAYCMTIADLKTSECNGQVILAADLEDFQ